MCRGYTEACCSYICLEEQNKDCALWCKNSIQCQRSKNTHHEKSALGDFSLSSTRFPHVHVDVVGLLSALRGMNNLLTSVDIFTRWSEAFPIPDQSADTIARAHFC
ncbi:hypothetical protein AVEN_73255-1 [Araneus ventricosus]|uniref:Uncharacterized protein n=1 Tax=Araneus ventricosus TaxID=182803 RepID=A0A4Y2F403_ARAVE|nr:hypothetical protein AVEN_73255-1 [Araneus ventricosus]